MEEDVLQRQIQPVMYNLKQAIDGANGFHNTHQIKQFESAKFCIDQLQGLIHSLFEHLSSLLESLLAIDQRGKSLESQRDNLDDLYYQIGRSFSKLGSEGCAWEAEQMHLHRFSCFCF